MKASITPCRRPCSAWTRRALALAAGPRRLDAVHGSPARAPRSALALPSCRTRPLAQSPLRRPHPATGRLARAADLLSNRLDGGPLRRILAIVLEHRPNRPLPHLGLVPLRLARDPPLARTVCLRQTRCGSATPFIRASVMTCWGRYQ